MATAGPDARVSKTELGPDQHAELLIFKHFKEILFHHLSLNFTPCLQIGVFTKAKHVLIDFRDCWAESMNFVFIYKIY